MPAGLCSVLHKKVFATFLLREKRLEFEVPFIRERPDLPPA